MMKHLPFCMALAAGLPLAAAELDSEAVGRDLNGWTAERVAWYGTDGLGFRASEPVVRPVENGAIEVTMRVEEVRGRVPVFLAEIKVVADAVGRIREASVEGSVDGVDYGTVTSQRPETAAEPADAAENLDPGTVQEDPEVVMRDELAGSLEGAIASARDGKGGARRDLASRFFGPKAGEAATLAEATGVALRSLFRRIGS